MAPTRHDPHVLDGPAGSATDGFVTCLRGCTHWGPYGAAGLLLRHADDSGASYLMQQRSPRVQHGGTWSIPGGALLDEHEPAEDAAAREALEELGQLPFIGPTHTVSDDHGGWTYHTVIAPTPRRFLPRGGGDGEASAHAWIPAGRPATGTHTATA